MSPLLTTLGAVASRDWLAARGLGSRAHHPWHVEIQLYADIPNARFELNLYPEEWGFLFRLRARLSWIRVTDLAFVHGADDLGLLGRTPHLDRIATLIDALEIEHGIRFDGHRAVVRTNLDEGRATLAVRAWLDERARRVEPAAD